MKFCPNNFNFYHFFFLLIRLTRLGYVLSGNNVRAFLLLFLGILLILLFLKLFGSLGPLLLLLLLRSSFLGPSCKFFNTRVFHKSFLGISLGVAKPTTAQTLLVHLFAI